MPEKKKRAILPPSGLAEDILRASEEEGTGADSSEVSRAPAGAIYDFADSFFKQTQTAQSAEVKLETWVTFFLGSELFALPVTHVQEILRVSSMTRVPHAPPAVRGITNLRGRVLPVVDLRLRIELPEKEPDGKSRILVLDSRGRRIGLLVDGVHQVVRLDMFKLEQTPADVMSAQSDYLLGVYALTPELLIILLDVDRVLLIRNREDSGGEVARAELRV